MKFNQTKNGTNKTVNHEGEIAYKLSHEMELYSLVCTSVFENKFYENKSDTITRLRKLIELVKPEFTVKLAQYARNEMYLRSIPLVLIVELAKLHKNDNLISLAIPSIIKRTDEITEILSYYQMANERKGTKKLNKLSNQLKKGIAKAFNNFDEYQFAKYNRKTQVSFKDALFLTHPKSIDKQKELLFKKIVDDELQVPYTWETQLSEAGKNGKSKTQVWQELIDSDKLGYMAKLRNLRNMLEAGVTMQHIQKVAREISNIQAVKKSKQLPFRFLSAYNELQEIGNTSTGILLNALEDAMIVSAENIKGYDYDTSVLIASDVSGSMMSTISPKSKVQYYDIGLVLSMLLKNKCKACITGMFGDDWKVINLPSKAILSNVQLLKAREGEVGYLTNGYKVIQYLNNKKIMIDKIMIFTDCQLWRSNSWGDDDIKDEWTKYKKINPNAKLYLFDLQGYGNTPLQINNDDVHLISGWSDKIFDVLHNIENGTKVIDQIKNYV